MDVCSRFIVSRGKMKQQYASVNVLFPGFSRSRFSYYGQLEKLECEQAVNESANDDIAGSDAASRYRCGIAVGSVVTVAVNPSRSRVRS
jgi:hypothetical protein